GLEQEPGRTRPQRPEDVLVEVEGGEHEDVGEPVGDDGPGGSDPVGAGHADVHEDDVGPQRPGVGHRGRTVGGLAHDGEAVGGLENKPQPGADGGVVVGDEHPDGHRSSSVGMAARTRQRSPSGPAWNVPPSASARSRMVSSPTPEDPSDGTVPQDVPDVATGRAATSLATSIRSAPASWSSVTSTGPPPPCRSALASASWTMR